jgi:type IV pilus assembly protein PilB
VQIARALSDQLGLPFLDLGSMPIAEETLAVLPRNVALRHEAVPVTLAHDVLTIALADVEGLEAGEEREEELEAVGDVDDAPVVRLVNAIMGEALHSRASDIHIEPQERDGRVRYRIDGLLREVTVVPKPIQGPLISRVKILSGMDISERRKPLVDHPA